LRLNIPLEYAITKVQKYYERLELITTHHLLVYTNDDNVLHENINITKKNTEALLDASRDVGLEVNVEKNQCMVMCRHQNAEQIHSLSFKP
jgi:hypothetical protein